jgi:5'-phosphate synthase pdxT subunit
MSSRPRVPGERLAGGSGLHRVGLGPAGADQRGDHGGEQSHGWGPLIGVVAVQGDVLEHLRLLEAAGSRARPVYRPEELDGCDGLVLPGGESTTVGRLLERYGLFQPLREALVQGLPVLGTCAGSILLCTRAHTHDGRRLDQPVLGVVDAVARRNAFGRQVASFETGVAVTGLGGPPMQGVFIRAPWFEELGPGVEVLATVPTAVGDTVVVVRQDNALAAAFHPELAGDARLHQLLLTIVEAQQATVG